MKSSFILILFIVNVVHADLSIDWANSNQPVYIGSSDGPYVSDGSLVQLIWNPNGITTDKPGSYNISGGSVLPGSYLLSRTTTAGGYGLWSGPLGNAGGGVFDDADVGGADINTGYFFTRIFNNPYGNAYWSFGGMLGFVDVNEVDASSYIYNPLDPRSIYSDNALGGSPAVIPAIPEPSSMVLLVLSVGMGVFMRRRLRN